MPFHRYLAIPMLVLSLIAGCGLKETGSASESKVADKAPRLKVVKVGVTQVTERSNGMATAAVIVENTSKTQSGIFAINYTLYDENGKILAREKVAEQVVRASQTMANVAPIHIGDTASIARIAADVALKDPTIDPQPGAAYTATDVRYQASNSIGFGKVIGVINSTYRATMSDVYVAVICYNANNDINGGDFTYLDTPVTGNGSQGFELEINTIGKPSKCDAYATPSALSKEL